MSCRCSVLSPLRPLDSSLGLRVGNPLPTTRPKNQCRAKYLMCGVLQSRVMLPRAIPTEIQPRPVYVVEATAPAGEFSILVGTGG